MNRYAVASVVGLASIASSTVVWIAVLLRHLPNPVFWNLSAAMSLLLSEGAVLFTSSTEHLSIIFSFFSIAGENRFQSAIKRWLVTRTSSCGY